MTGARKEKLSKSNTNLAKVKPIPLSANLEEKKLLFQNQKIHCKTAYI